jgi:hypothetical protein
LIQQKGKIMAKIFLSISIIIFFLGCEQLENISELNTSHKYPSQVGQEWEYNTMWKSEYYDQSGGINIASLENLGNTVVRITKVNERLGTYNNLILFESFEVNTPQNIQRMWYSNSDTGLFAIAYSNPGASQPVFPKQSIMSFEQLKHFIKTIGTFPGYFEAAKTLNQAADTIQFYTPPRKALMYPLTIGSRWIELTTPFFRERFIQKQQIINANGRNYNCYKIESNMSWPNFEFNDYIDMNSGLIVREIIADSMMIVTVTNPDSGAFVKSTTISRLVRETK